MHCFNETCNLGRIWIWICHCFFLRVHQNLIETCHLSPRVSPILGYFEAARSLQSPSLIFLMVWSNIWFLSSQDEQTRNSVVMVLQSFGWYSDKNTMITHFKLLTLFQISYLKMVTWRALDMRWTWTFLVLALVQGLIQVQGIGQGQSKVTLRTLWLAN